MKYPLQTLDLMARNDHMGEWWRQAVAEWERLQEGRKRHLKVAGRLEKDAPSSGWLPRPFDPMKVCSAKGPTGLPCADPWCSEPGVVAPGHDRH